MSKNKWYPRLYTRDEWTQELKLFKEQLAISKNNVIVLYTRQITNKVVDLIKYKKNREL